MGVARGIGNALRQRRQWDMQDEAMQMNRKRMALGEQRMARQEARQARYDEMNEIKFKEQQDSLGRQRQQQEDLARAQYDTRKNKFLADLEAGLPKEEVVKAHGSGKWDDFTQANDGSLVFKKGGKEVGRLPRSERDAFRQVLSQRQQAAQAGEMEGLKKQKLQTDIQAAQAKPEQARTAGVDKQLAAVQEQLDGVSRDKAKAVTVDGIDAKEVDLKYESIETPLKSRRNTLLATKYGVPADVITEAESANFPPDKMAELVKAYMQRNPSADPTTAARAVLRAASATSGGAKK
jgi:hypothetical protein